MIGKLRSIYKRFFRKKICTDCKIKLDKHFGLKSRLKARIHRRKHRVKHSHKSRTRSSIKHKLRAGIHKVKIRGKMRKVKVLKTGQWRFMKS